MIGKGKRMLDLCPCWREGRGGEGRGGEGRGGEGRGGEGRGGEGKGRKGGRPREGGREGVQVEGKERESVLNWTLCAILVAKCSRIAVRSTGVPPP